MVAATVVIPTRNRPDLLCLTLTSVLRQRDVDLQVIVVDDGSTEDTAGVVSRSGDHRVRVLRQATSKGVSTARNVGLSEVTTEWVAFCDDDDLWSPDKLWPAAATVCPGSTGHHRRRTPPTQWSLPTTRRFVPC